MKKILYVWLTIPISYSETKIANQLEHNELIHKQYVEHFLANLTWGNDSLMKVSPHSLELFCHALNNSS